MFFKILKYDLKNSYLKNAKKLLIAAGVILLFIVKLYISLYNSTQSGLAAGVETLSFENTTFLNCCLYFFGGMDDIEVLGYFQIPIMWMLLHMLIFYFVLYYPFDDLMEYGRHVLLLSRSRVSWWLSKCVTTLVWVISYFALIWAEIAGFCLITGIKLSFEVTDMGVENYASLPPLSDNLRSHLYREQSMFTAIIVLPLLVAAAMALFQMLMSLIVRPIPGFIITSAIIFLSVYYLKPIMIGNYALPIRSNLVVNGGFTQTAGLIYSTVVIVLTTVVGALIFRKYDILNKEG